MTVVEQIDLWLASLLALIDERQTQYYKVHGRYWQGLWTHAEAPSGEAAADRMASKPLDQTERWSDFAPEAGGPVRARLRVDVYSGPQGDGYLLWVQTVVNERIFERVMITGAESYRERGWRARPLPLVEWAR